MGIIANDKHNYCGQEPGGCAVTIYMDPLNNGRQAYLYLSVTVHSETSCLYFHYIKPSRR